MDDKIKHLEFIQDVINRMASNSFLIKGWTVVLVAALFALGSADRNNSALIYLAYFPSIVFWLLDGYYLWQERLFRHLYEEVQVKTGNVDFSMKTDAKSERYGRAIFSITIAGFHIPILTVIFIVSKFI